MVIQWEFTSKNGDSMGIYQQMVIQWEFTSKNGDSIGIYQPRLWFIFGIYQQKWWFNVNLPAKIVI